MPSCHRHTSLHVIALLATLFLLPPARAADPVTLHSFEADANGWRPRAKSISVSYVEKEGATAGSKGCLRIQGPIETGWNYAASPHHAIEPGKLYRLTAWLRVDRLGQETPAPYLKCEFVARQSRGMAGQVHTDPYETSQPGTWQKLVLEFQVPDNAAACWLALEKGTNGPAEIDASLDDITLERIARLSVVDQYRLDPMPAELESVRGVHPRLYLNPAKVTELREAVGTTHAGMWKELQERADRYTKSGPPAYREQDGHSGDEQLWQRSVGNAMPTLAMAYVVTGDRKYLAGAQAWALASCGSKFLGLIRIDVMDLASFH